MDSHIRKFQKYSLWWDFLHKQYKLRWIRDLKVNGYLEQELKIPKASLKCL